MTGVPVDASRSVSTCCPPLMAGIAGVLEVGWLGGVTTDMGQSMELSVIAAAVIGGANLMGGSGTVLGAVVGAALIEIIRNSLTLLGISTFWQGAFVGTFILWQWRSTASAAGDATRPGDVPAILRHP